MKRRRLREAILRRWGGVGEAVVLGIVQGRVAMTCMKYKKSQKCTGVMKRSLILSGNSTTPLRRVLEPARLVLGHAEDVHILSRNIEQWPREIQWRCEWIELRRADG